jgi:hypothetical protein
MAGLLDVLNSDQGRMALGLLAAAGPRSDGAGFGQRLQEGMGSFDAYKQNALKQKMLEAQMQQAMDQAAQQKAAMAQQANQRNLMSQFFKPASQGAPALNMDSMMPQEMRTGMPDQPAIAPRKAGIDTSMIPQLIRAGVPMKDIMEADGFRNLGLDEVARTVEGKGADGGPVTYQKDRFGRDVGQAIPKWLAATQTDLGGSIAFLDPVTHQPRANMPKTMTFSDRNAAGNLALSRERLNFDKQGGAEAAKPVYNEALGAWLYRPDQKNPMGRTVKVDGAGGGKMTEDQAKASGWLVQAENAFKNMKAATATNPDASKPGFNDAFAAIPSLGLTTGIANIMRGPARQQYMQGASSMSEALLRAATGAGVNKDEALQKVRELTPQIGDSDAVIAQKEAAIPLYIESLKMRAGPGASRAQVITNSGTQREIDMSDPLGLRGGGNDPLNIMGR